MNDQEIILNLWYVHDEHGFIYSLRVRAYVMVGSDEQKLRFLRERALLDYLIADPFEVSSRHHVTIIEGDEKKKLPVGHVRMLETFESPIAIFEDAMKKLQARMPAQTKVQISQSALTCTRPLIQSSNGDIVPQFSGKTEYPH